METQHNLAKVLREVDCGESVTITRRKKPVAKLVPIEEDETTFPDFNARARKTWSGDWKGASSDDLVAESRGSR